MARHQSKRYDVVCSVINEIFGKYASQVECVTETEHFTEAILKEVTISFFSFGKQTHRKKKTTDKEGKINKQTHE